MTDFIFLFSLGYLLLLSLEDLLQEKIDNNLIFGFFFLGLGVKVYQHQWMITIIGMILMFCLAYVLWIKDTIGGADAKLLVATIPWIHYNGFPNMMINIWFFMIFLLITGFLYSFVWAKIGNSKREIPFVPIITLAFILIYVYKIF